MRLHIVTDDAILARHDFIELAKQFPQEALLHLRGHKTTAAELVRILEQLDGERIIVNDRVDVAMAGGARGVHLGVRSLPLEIVRDLLDSDSLLGFSAHSPEEAKFAIEHGADYAFLGPVFETPSHRGQAGQGAALIPSSHHRIIAIGGIKPDNVREVLEAGAAGVAVISAIWEARDPVQAASEFVKILHDQSRSER